MGKGWPGEGTGKSAEHLYDRRRRSGHGCVSAGWSGFPSSVGLAYPPFVSKLAKVESKLSKSYFLPGVYRVDYWAKRKGRSYGIILVDLARHCPIDLLDDATSEALIVWLVGHPGVESIRRDRDKEYALGEAKGAPEATQVADRWHLLKNVGDTLEAVFTQHQEWLRHAASEATAAGEEPPEEVSAPSDETPAERDRAARREMRVQRYDEVKTLQAGGMNLSELARTIVKYVRAEHFPERARRRPGAADLAPYDAYLRKRWSAGCHNGTRLWLELRE